MVSLTDKLSDKEAAEFWKKIAGWLFIVLWGVVSFVAGVTVTASSSILTYYKDAPLIDRRLADLEDRVDRNDARITGHHSFEWEEMLKTKRENYEPMLKAAQR